ncbi:hypothetical protein B566_EDAN008980 [Ephemera danica]|nr:hypothetical protein B566_EDAN008980 [Ephemera danica]
MTSNEDEFNLVLEVSNYEPDEIKVEITDKYVTVEGRHESKTTSGKSSSSSHFNQHFSLPSNVKKEDVKWDLSDGILRIYAQSKTKKIKSLYPFN